MNRNLLVSFFLIILLVQVDAQVQYRVIKVNGNIVYVNTGNQMNQGDQFNEDEDLSFRTANSRAAVINPERGRFVLTPDNYEDLSSAKSNFLPGMSNISTRGGAINTMTDLQNVFSDNLAVLSKVSYYINPYNFPMSESQFFYLGYQYKGEPINKKLDFEDNKLILLRENILKVDNNPITKADSPETSLYYFKNGESSIIGNFNLIFPDLILLKSETAILLEEFQEKSYNEKVNETAGYIFEFYGKCDKQDVINFLEEEFGLKRE